MSELTFNHCVLLHIPVPDVFASLLKLYIFIYGITLGV